MADEGLIKNKGDELRKKEGRDRSLGRKLGDYFLGKDIQRHYTYMLHSSNEYDEVEDMELWRQRLLKSKEFHKVINYKLPNVLGILGIGLTAYFKEPLFAMVPIFGECLRNISRAYFENERISDLGSLFDVIDTEEVIESFNRGSWDRDGESWKGEE